MKVARIENVRGLDGRGLAITVVIKGLVSEKSREAFKTDGSATHWQWLEDGEPCPHEVWMAWEAHKAQNILAGKPAYTASFSAPAR
jgi:hypothetical protein